MDLCSGGMIWSCCVEKELTTNADTNVGVVHNASKYKRDSTFTHKTNLQRLGNICLLSVIAELF